MRSQRRDNTCYLFSFTMHWHILGYVILPLAYNGDPMSLPQLSSPLWASSFFPNLLIQNLTVVFKSPQLALLYIISSNSVSVVVSAPVTWQGCVQVSRFPRLHRSGPVHLQPQADAGEPAETHSLETNRQSNTPADRRKQINKHNWKLLNRDYSFDRRSLDKEIFNTTRENSI